MNRSLLSFIIILFSLITTCNTGFCMPYSQEFKNNILSKFTTTIDFNQFTLKDSFLLHDAINVGLAVASENPTNAMHLAQNVQLIASHINWKPGIADAHRLKSNIYLILDLKSKALEEQFISIAINESINRQYAVGNGYAGLFSIYNLDGRFEDAKNVARKAINAFEKVDNGNGIAIGYSLLASYYSSLNNFDSAFYYFDKSLSTFKSTIDIDSFDYIGVEFNYAVTLKKDAQYVAAYKLYAKYLNIRSDLFTKYERAILFDNIGCLILAAYIDASSFDYSTLEQFIGPKKEWLSKAKWYLETAYKQSKENGYTIVLLDVNEQLSNLYKLEKNYEKSLEHYQAFD